MITVRVADRDGTIEQHVFETSDITVGRVAGNELVLAKGSVSKKHARITLKDGNFYVTDLKSTNGTSVEGFKIQATHLVRPGERIAVGDFLLTLSMTVRVEVAAPVAPSVAAAPQMPQAPRIAPPEPSAYPTPRGLASAGRPAPTAALRVGTELDEDVDDLIDSLSTGDHPASNARAARSGTPIAPVPTVGHSQPVPQVAPSSPTPHRFAPGPGTAPLPMAHRLPNPAPPTSTGGHAPASEPSTLRRSGGPVPGGASMPSGLRISEHHDHEVSAPPSRNTFTSRVRFDETFPNRGTRSFRLRLDSTGRMTVSAQGSGEYKLPHPSPPFVHARTEAVAILLANGMDLSEVSYPPEPGIRTQQIPYISQALDNLDSAAPVQDGMRDVLIRLVADDLTAVGPCEAYLNDPEISAIHAPTWDHVYLTRRGRTMPAPFAFASRDAFVRALERIVRGRTGSDGSISELRTTDGLVYRVSSPDGPAPSLFAMRDNAPTATLDDFVTRGAAPASLAALLPQLLRAGAGIALVASSIFDASHVARALAARAAVSLPVIAGSTDARLANLGFGVVDPSATFGADVDALSPAVVLFDDVDYAAVSSFLTYPGTRASAWLLPMAATSAEIVVPQLAATVAHVEALPEQLAREVAVARLHCIVQVQRAEDGKLFISAVWDVDSSANPPQLRRIFGVMGAPNSFTWEESTPAPRVARLLSAWAETGVQFDAGVDAAFWCNQAPSRRVAIGR